MDLPKRKYLALPTNLVESICIFSTRQSQDRVGNSRLGGVDS